ncbi:MAG TPA: flagellar basal body P-ring protein FlgI [Tepidisphaeraceae bacterium]|jgi:flagellar P-ring protein precursor FlgI|nr:flagellar basal body P-ring protein FlgI [Tepidisphaeraceae bacterium]
MRKWLVILIAMVCSTRAAFAVKVADITRISGQRTNVLTGLGLVVGLKGTGDGGDFSPAIKPLASMLKKFSDSSTTAELANVANVALVTVTATVPANGVREGDKIDAYITSLGAASSLKGGRLFITPLLGPTGDLAPQGLPFAMVEGPVVLEDPSTPTVGKVASGAVMEMDLPAHYIDNGRFTLVIEDPSASWTNASTIAKIINDSEGNNGETLAVAVDPKNVVVNIPVNEREHPDSFISRVQRLPVPMLPSEARVQINDKTGTMILTGDVEISPVVISHKGLTISTIDPAPVPTPRTPVVNTKDVISLDTMNQGGAKLQDLVNALDQLKVPAEDRIAIVKELYKTGKLHAKLIVE